MNVKVDTRVWATRILERMCWNTADTTTTTDHVCISSEYFGFVTARNKQDSVGWDRLAQFSYLKLQWCEYYIFEFVCIHRPHTYAFHSFFDKYIILATFIVALRAFPFRHWRICNHVTKLYNIMSDNLLIFWYRFVI